LTKLFFLFFISTSFIDAQDLGETTVYGQRPTISYPPAATSVAPATFKYSTSTKPLEYFKTLPSIQTSQNGGIGQNSSLFLRGSDAGKILVLQDGLRVNDAMNVNRSFNFAQLPALFLKNIDVYPGAHGVALGSDASSGVINIESIQEMQHKAHLALYGSSANTYGLGSLLNLSQPKTTFHHLLGAHFLTSNALSSAKGGLEKDEASQLDLYWSLKKASQWRLGASLQHLNNDIDAGGGPSNDNPYNEANSKQYKTWGERTFNWSADHQTYLFGGITALRRQTNTTTSHSVFKSQTWQTKATDEHLLQANWRHRSQLEIIHEKGQSTSNLDREQTQVGLGLSQEWSPGRFTAQYGLRFDYANPNTALSTTSILQYRFLPSLTAYGSFQTGFKFPSLFQRYSSFGDPNLSKEKSETVELGLKQSLQAIELRQSLFQTKVQDLIDYNFAQSKYINTSKASIKGIELTAQTTWISPWQLAMNYTYLLPRELPSKRLLLRRAKELARLELRYEVDSWGLRLTSEYTSKREDVDPINFNRQVVSSFYLQHLEFLLKREHWDGVLRLSNIFDKDYEEVLGYSTLGREIAIDLKWRI
jgi:vitamin B12 transporter